MNVYKPIIIIYFILFCNISAQWVQTNGPEGGTIRQLLKVQLSQTEARIFAGAYAGGLFVSNDLGESWSPVLKEGKSFGTIVFLKKYGNYIYLLSLTGFYRSSDNGLTWESIGNGIPNKSLSGLAYNNGKLYGSSGNGIYISLDYGLNWSLFSNELNNLDCIEVCDSAIIMASRGLIKYSRDLGHSWNDSKNVIPNSTINYLSFHGKYLFCTMDYTIYRSSDYGASWVKSDSGIRNMYGGKAATERLMESGDNLYSAASTGGIFISKDNGLSWNIISEQTYKFGARPLEKHNDVILAGTVSEGIYRSIDDGKTWAKQNKGLVCSEVDCFASDDSSLFVGVSQYFTYFSNDKGNNWKEINLARKGSNATSLILRGNVLIKTFLLSSMLYSVDYGANWNPILYLGYPSISLAVYDEDGLFIGSKREGVYYLKDFTSSWMAMNNGLTNYNVNSLIKIGDYLYAATDGGEGVYRSTDKGQNWTPYNSGLTNKNVNQICKVSKNLFASTQNGLFRFNGSTWLEVYPKISNYVYMFAIDNYLFVARTNSLTMTSDYGQNWAQVDSGLFIHPVVAMTVSGEYLYAGTNGGGVFKRPISELIKPTGVKENKHKMVSFSLEQNYPNPFNPSTTINYSIPQRNFVVLKVYDMLGCEVKTLIKQDQNAGDYGVQFNGSSLPSGVYIYTLQTGNFRKSKKLLLMK